MVKLEIKNNLFWGTYELHMSTGGKLVWVEDYTRKSSAIRGAKRLAKHFKEPVRIYVDGELLCWMTPL